MADMTLKPEFEDDIRLSFDVPVIRAEFVDQLYSDLMQRAADKSHQSRRYFNLRPAWIIALAVLALLIIGALAIGPDRVYAAMRQLFGYIPGIGIVDRSAPLRVLAEPVSITRDGVTVSVNQAVLTANETQLRFGISGVPLSAYPKGEAVTGCIKQGYIRLPDGTKLDVNAVIPSGVNEATFVLPCIFNTLPGTVPTDWELHIHFISAARDLTVMPILDVPSSVPSINKGEHGEPTRTVDAPAATPSSPGGADVSVKKIIETDDGYILLGVVQAHLPEGSWLQVTGPAVIRDANDKKVSYSIPNDIQPSDDPGLGQGGFSWALKIKSEGVIFPLTIRFFGVVISQVDPLASAQVEFDAGPNPNPDQVWTLNQDFRLAGNGVRLISITAQSDGYSFRIDPGVNLSGLSVQIAGAQPNGGGGGGSGTSGGEFTTSLSYTELPKGKLTLVFSNPLRASASQMWQGQWSPDSTGNKVTTPPANSSQVCLDADSYQKIKDIPAGLDGWMVLTEINPDLRLVLSSFDGKTTQVLAPHGSRGAVSLDGLRIAYPGSDGISMVNRTTGETTTLNGVSGYDLHWSPNGQQIALLNNGSAFGVFIVNSDGSGLSQFSNLGYESIAGWSADGSQLYFAIPDAGEKGFLLRSFELSSGHVRDVFVLEDSSRKAPMPSLSPDGKWIAYRASDNSSLYIKGLDGSPARMLLESPGTAINGIAWEKQSHLLGISLITPAAPDGEIILIQFDNCEAYRIPGMQGELEGIILP